MASTFQTSAGWVCKYFVKSPKADNNAHSSEYATVCTALPYAQLNTPSPNAVQERL